GSGGGAGGTGAASAGGAGGGTDASTSASAGGAGGVVDASSPPTASDASATNPKSASRCGRDTASSRGGRPTLPPLRRPGHRPRLPPRRPPRKVALFKCRDPMTTQQRAQYHQLHPAKLLVDWGTAALAGSLLWQRRPVAAVVVGFGPSLLVTLLFLSGRLD